MRLTWKLFAPPIVWLAIYSGVVVLCVYLVKHARSVDADAIDTLHTVLEVTSRLAAPLDLAGLISPHSLLGT